MQKSANQASPLLALFDRGELSFAEAAKRLEQEKERIEGENEDLFLPYIGALESLKESIDLEHLAAFGMDEASDSRQSTIGPIPNVPRCLVPAFDGALFSQQWKDALWDRFYTGAPARQRQSVERYNIVKRA